MGCDMVVALARATADGSTLFGHNCNRPGGEELSLLRVAGRAYAPGETLQAGTVVLPQARRTWTVLAGHCPGEWGYRHGVNEHGVSCGLTTIRTRLHSGSVGLTGSALVRLALERAASARQAVDVLADLVGRHGQTGAETGFDPAFLIADGREAFVVEMSGPHWAVQAVGEVRAVSDVCQLRQDWDRLSPGLADLAIGRGWWPANGSKLDFAGAVGPECGDNAPSLRRWGRATLLLEQHNGQIDLGVVRRVLRDHFEGRPDASGLCRHAAGSADHQTSASLLTQSRPGDALPVAWYAFGPPCAGVYFPLLLLGELPPNFQALTAHLRTGGRPLPAHGALALRELQERFDLETQEFLAEAAVLRQRGEAGQLPRLAELFMQHNLESWENLCLELVPTEVRTVRARPISESSYCGAWS